jgi:hypothetical protein
VLSPERTDQDDYRYNVRPVAVSTRLSALVEVFVHGGLSWGGCYASGKDLMHFDLRTGTIKAGRDEL